MDVWAWITSNRFLGLGSLGGVGWGGGPGEGLGLGSLGGVGWGGGPGEGLGLGSLGGVGWRFRFIWRSTLYYKYTYNNIVQLCLFNIYVVNT